MKPNYQFISRILFCLIVGLGLYSGNLYAFNIVMNFDNGTPGDKVMGGCDMATNQYRFTGDANKTVYTKDDAFGLGESAQLTVDKGTSGFGNFGGILKLDKCVGEELKEGDEIWIRLRMKFPYNWMFTPGERLKFIRLRAYTPSGDAITYNDFELSHPDGPGETFHPFHYIPEFDADGGWKLLGDPSQYINFGVWETYEVYFKINYITADEDPVNGARVVAWKNGKLVGEVTDKRTLPGPGHTIRDFYLFTWWNGHQGKGDAPQTQSVLIDDLRITNERPEVKNGDYYMIGIDANRIPRAPEIME
jgi:hypothetical protein